MKSLFLTLVLSFVVSGCALDWDRGESVPYKFSMDGTKLISTDRANGNDPSTYEQDKFWIDSSHRLLVRFEALSNEAKRVDTNKSVQVQLTLIDPGQETDASRNLLLCPLSKNWMMLATWTRAHPFGPTGVWADGGEFDRADCLKRIPPDSTAVAGVLLYDITQWFHDYPQGRGVNFGFIVIADTNSYQIYGDRSQSYSPRILLNKYTWR